MYKFCYVGKINALLLLVNISSLAANCSAANFSLSKLTTPTLQCQINTACMPNNIIPWVCLVSDDSQQPLTTLSSPALAFQQSPLPPTSLDDPPCESQFRLSRRTSRSKLNRFASAVGRAFRCIPSESST